MQTSTAAFEPREDEDYAHLLNVLHGALAGDQPLFTTDAVGLYDAFLLSLPGNRRQHYACRTCRRFVEHYGNLVTIGESGATTSPLWDGWVHPSGGRGDACRFFLDGIHAISNRVGKARVTGVFLTSDSVLGCASNSSPKSPTGQWHHMHSTARPMKRNPLATADQIMAEKREDYGTLCRALAEFPEELVRRTHALLTTGGLYRSEKCVGTAKWLLDLHEAREATKNARTRENLTWRAVTTAPPGFCHVRSTIIGTLLEDVAAGKPFEEIKRAFDAKVHPLQYQRPQAPPTDGQLTAAEEVIRKLASAGALARRFATLADVAADAVWMPKEKSPEAPGSVFGHLKSGRAAPEPIDVPAQVITWDKFWRTVLLEADRVEYRVPMRGNFFAFVTAADPDAPPILQWDRDDSRNPVSWYIYHGGSMASAWGIRAGAFVTVTAITTQPSSWGGGGEHHGNGAYFVLDGAKDSQKSGLALFPEILKSEYHGVRVAMEAYSRSREIAPTDGSACGLALQKSAGSWDAVVRVTSRGVRAIYKLERWD
jgi:hypothetical protein